MEQFLIEFIVIIAIFFVLKIFWNARLKFWLGNFVIGMNVFACILYLYGFYSNVMPYGDAFSKVLLHSVVAIIIHTLFSLDEKKKIK